MSDMNAPPVEKSAEPAEKATESKTYQQADVDSLLDKVRKTEEAKRNKLVSELEERRKAAMTDDEKRIQAAREEGAKEAKAQLDAVKRADALKDALLESGINSKRLRHALALAKEFAGPESETEEVIEVLKRESPELFTGPKFGPPDGNNSPRNGPNVDWTAEKIEAELEKLNPTQQREWQLAHAKEIEEYNNRTRGWRTIPPGVKGF